MRALNRFDKGSRAHTLRMGRPRPILSLDWFPSGLAHWIVEKFGFEKQKSDWNYQTTKDLSQQIYQDLDSLLEQCWVVGSQREMRGFEKLLINLQKFPCEKLMTQPSKGHQRVVILALQRLDPEDWFPKDFFVVTYHNNPPNF